MFKIYRYVIILFSVFFLYSGCKKENKDYREKYLGDWLFITNAYDLTYSPPIDPDTIYNYQGKIWIDSSNKIIIEYEKNHLVAANVTLEGVINRDYLYNGSYEIGSFINNDSLYISLILLPNHPKVIRHIVKGIKNN